MNHTPSKSFWSDTVDYAKRIQTFQKTDWVVYVMWIGLMLGLFICVAGFIGVGWYHQVAYPDYVWNIPVGTFLFVAAIAFDTIGHRTIYKEA